MKIEQLDSQTQDTEIRDVAEEIGDILQAAFDVLIQRRDRQYAAAIEPLNAERDTLTQESASIEEARVNLERLLPAKARENTLAARPKGILQAPFAEKLSEPDRTLIGYRHRIGGKGSARNESLPPSCLQKNIIESHHPSV